MTWFFVLAALMLAAALAFVLPPLLRGAAVRDPHAAASEKLQALESARAAGILDDAEYASKRAALGTALLDAAGGPAARPQSARRAAFALALLLPAVAIALYRLVGEPRAFDPNAQTAAADEHSQGMQQAIAGLAAKLKQNPDDVQGWALLGRAYQATQHFAEARDALKRAHELAPDDADLSVAYAEALTLASPTRRVEGEPRALVDAVLKTAPDNERGLWLLGISEYQAQHYDPAIAAWKHLLAVLPHDSDIAPTVQQQIDQAEAERDGRAPAPAAGTAVAGADTDTPSTAAADSTAATNDAASPQLHVEVALDAKLRDKLGANDIVFVYAKAASGPPMPLAVQRVPASKLPLSVTLTDGMGMLPNMKLSQFPQVIVGARVSKSGNAIAQSGDLQTQTAPLAVSTTTPIKLTIDQIVP